MIDLPFTQVGVVGAGTMGAGIAYVLAAAGFETFVAEPDDARRTALRETLRTQSERGVARSKLDAATAAALLARVHPLDRAAAIPEGLGLVIETVPERPALKQTVLAEIDARRPEMIATNTSSLQIAGLAGAVSRPDRFCGMHFFNPVWSLALVEVIRAEATGDETVARATAVAERIGKQAIVVRDVPGFATSRLDLAAALEAMRMLEDGVASAEDIDRAATLAYRHPVGPLRLSDIVGLDVRLDICEQLAPVYGERFAAPAILRRKVAAGELGQKTGLGFFAW